MANPAAALLSLTLPRTLFGAGAISALRTELAALGVSRPLLVTDKGLVAAGLTAKVVAAHDDGTMLAVFDGVTENPLFSDRRVGAQRAKRVDASGCSRARIPG